MATLITESVRSIAMKLCAQMGLLIALAVALAFTFSPVADDQVDPVPGTGPASEPHPITLRACANEVIIRAMIDDGLSLPEAAALCREVYRLLPDPPSLDVLTENDANDRPAATADERLCRHVIGWVRTRPQTAATVARLEAEFREWLRQGTGRLPDPQGLVPSPTDLLKKARAEWVAFSRGNRRRHPPGGGGFNRNE
jgi:hypothetical protein